MGAGTQSPLFLRNATRDTGRSHQARVAECVGAHPQIAVHETLGEAPAGPVAARCCPGDDQWGEVLQTRVGAREIIRLGGGVDHRLEVSALHPPPQPVLERQCPRIGRAIAPEKPQVVHRAPGADLLRP